MGLMEVRLKESAGEVKGVSEENGNWPLPSTVAQNGEMKNGETVVLGKKATPPPVVEHESNTGQSGACCTTISLHAASSCQAVSAFRT